MNVESLRQFIQTELLINSESPIENEQDLLISGLLDSLNVMKLVAYIEGALTITIPPEDIVLENFGSISDMVNYLKSRDIELGTN